MDFTYLRTFCEVARWGNFTRAAEELGYAQSSVTMQVQKLQEQYGAVLFERYGRRMQLTQAGEVFLPYARQILALHTEVKAQLCEQQTGTITLGTIETLAAYYLPPIIQTFCERHPGITITLQSGNEASLVQAVKEGRCDLGLILDDLWEDPELERVVLRKEEIVIVARPDSAYGHLAQISLPQLAEARFILTEEGCTYRALLLQTLRQTGITPHIVGEFGSLEAIKQWVLAGLGIAFLPRTTVQEEVAQGKLHAIELESVRGLYVQMVYVKRKWQSAAFQDLLILFDQPTLSLHRTN